MEVLGGLGNVVETYDLSLGWKVSLCSLNFFRRMFSTSSEIKSNFFQLAVVKMFFQIGKYVLKKTEPNVSSTSLSNFINSFTSGSSTERLMKIKSIYLIIKMYFKYIPSKEFFYQNENP